MAKLNQHVLLAQQLQPDGSDRKYVTAVSSDYDGDGKADFAVRNGATWIIRKSSDGSIYSQTPSGDLSSDIAVQNDYDGDGKTDIAVWRAIESSPGAGDIGYWYIRQSASGTTRTVRWGIANDIPVPALYRR